MGAAGRRRQERRHDTNPRDGVRRNMTTSIWHTTTFSERPPSWIGTSYRWALSSPGIVHNPRGVFPPPVPTLQGSRSGT